MTFTTLFGTPCDVSPLAFVGASPRMVTSLINGKEAVVYGCEIKLVDGSRGVLQSADEVRRIFEAAMEGVAITVIAPPPPLPDDAPAVD